MRFLLGDPARVGCGDVQSRTGRPPKMGLRLPMASLNLVPRLLLIQRPGPCSPFDHLSRSEWAAPLSAAPPAGDSRPCQVQCQYLAAVVATRHRSARPDCAARQKGWRYSSRHPLHERRGLLNRPWVLSLPDTVHLRPTDGAGTARGGLTVLHGHLAGVPHVPHRAAFEAIGLHSTSPPYLSRAAPVR